METLSQNLATSKKPKALVDLTASKALATGRAFINGCHKLFSGAPVFRDFIPEFFSGLIFIPKTGRFSVPTLGGRKIVVEPKLGGIVEKALFSAGTYESGVWRLIQRLIEPGDSFVDVGANVGAITVYAADFVGPKGRVYSFEPVASTAELLSQTIEINNFGNVSLYELALSNVSGQSPIFTPFEHNRGGNSLDQTARAGELQKVRLERLDNVMSAEEWKKVSVMKIDVEGWELEVLEGAQRLMSTGHIPALIVEYTRDGSAKTQNLYNFLSSLPGCGLYKMKYTKRCDGPLVKVSKESELYERDNVVVLPDAMRGRVSNSK